MEPIIFLLGAGAIYKFLQNRKEKAAIIIPGRGVGAVLASSNGVPELPKIDDFLVSPGPGGYGPGGGAVTGCRICAAARQPAGSGPPAPQLPAPPRQLPAPPRLTFTGTGFTVSGPGPRLRQPVSYF